MNSARSWLVGVTVVLLSSGASAAETSRSRQRFESLLNRLDEVAAESQDTAEAVRLREAIDAEGGQKYAWKSRLFWHTDIDEARAEARQRQVPIISLRLLGRLTDDLSCANSRFFRTALYANREVSQILRERFVLHWSSERPVPVLTVDFGDGRSMKRTVTGNSIHYLLDAEGRPIDALPGMHGPRSFQRWLEFATAYHRQLEAARPAVLRSEMRRQQGEWDQLLASVGRSSAAPDGAPVAAERLRAARLESLRTTPSGAGERAGKRPVSAPVPAERAVRLAVPKMILEVGIIPHLTLAGLPAEDVKDPDFWRQLSERVLDDCRLDASSKELIALQRPIADSTESGLARIVDRFERNIALDTVRNRFVLQRRVRDWLLNEPTDFESLNERVYRELFLTPRDDAYLGLLPEDVYSGLENGGLASQPTADERQ